MSDSEVAGSGEGAGDNGRGMGETEGTTGEAVGEGVRGVSAVPAVLTVPVVPGEGWRRGAVRRWRPRWRPGWKGSLGWVERLWCSWRLGLPGSRWGLRSLGRLRLLRGLNGLRRRWCRRGSRELDWPRGQGHRRVARGMTG